MEGNDAIKMATSVLDYLFRELAISYLGRHDLAHAEPADLMPDTVGHGLADTAAPHDDGAPAAVPAVSHWASNGYVRGQLRVLSGGQSGARAQKQADTATMSVVASETVSGDSVGLAVAVEAAVVENADPRLERIREARLKGYEGDACGECGNFTLVRNGTCLKCDTCGGTSGCS